MKVKDESEWQGQLALFASDPAPEAAVLRDFIVAWTETAEYRIDNNWKMVSGFEADKPKPSPIEGLRLTLRSVEQDKGRVPIGYLGMALLLIGEHWEPITSIDEFFDSLTPIEQNLYADVASVKFLDLQRQAEESVDG